MAKTSTCDGCGKVISPDNPLSLKLFLYPVNGFVPKGAPTQYTSHMDIGKCCTVKAHQLGKWQQRRRRTPIKT